MSEHVLVTGGAGFIGSHLVDFLIKKKYRVTVIDNLSTGKIENLKNSIRKIKFIKEDISNKKRIINYFKKADYVFHLAALADIVPSIQKPQEYFRSNVEGTLSVLECCKKYKVKKLIYAASASCYGLPKKFPTNEKQKINPMYPYALTKWIGEEVYKIKANSLRLFNVYGPRSRSNSNYGAVFGVFLAQKLSNKPFTIVGNGKQTRDFTFVTDVVGALYKACKSKISGEIFNVGSEKEVSVNQIVKLLKGKKNNIPKRPGEPDRSLADIKKIKKMLHWSPKISINQGIKILLDNINYWKKAPLWNPKSIKKATIDWFKYLQN
jgi:UDP-glucose 4-epimerase